MPDTLSPRMEDYLEAILWLQEENPVARVGEVAEALDVSRPTVTAAVKALGEGGFVEHESYGYIQLTPKGRRAAERVTRRHGLLRRFFEEVLGVDAERAAEDACRVEHHMSLDTAQRLARFVEFIENCPRSGPDWLKRFQCYCEREEGAGAVGANCPEECLKRCLDAFATSQAGMCGTGVENGILQRTERILTGQSALDPEVVGMVIEDLAGDLDLTAFQRDFEINEAASRVVAQVPYGSDIYIVEIPAISKVKIFIHDRLIYAVR